MASNDVLGLDGFCTVLAIVFVCMDPGLSTLLVLLVFLHTSQHAGQQLWVPTWSWEELATCRNSRTGEPQPLSTKFWDIPRVEEP